MTNAQSEYDGGLALVGMSGRFPGAQNVETFWQNIASGVKSIRLFSDEELLAAGVDPTQLAQPNFVKAGSLLAQIDQFDAAFFGYTPREAELMDPQHRLFLECAWEALEGAGYNTEADHGLIGIYAGSSFCSYLVNNLYADPDFLATVGVVQASVGNERDALTSTVSYKLNLKGPSVVVQTFCSTSLVAVHMACQSLLNYECDMAMAGGVAISVPHMGGYMYEEGGIVSPDGECRTFDANAQGSVMGHGVGIVLIKRLAEAIESGDHIYAVIRGSAVNNDGSHRVSITAPGLDGQTEVIAEAIENAGVPIESINYIEAHGTATEMGDAVELAAMMKAFEDQTTEKQFCAIGSVKPNVGHLDRAAGVSGLIKTTLALAHKQLPPSLNFEQAGADMDLPNSPFYVNTQLQDWQAGATPRRAGVSSFGLGGTNAHVILEEAPERDPGSPSRPWQLLLLSAKTETALQQATTNLQAHLQAHPEQALEDVAYTLQSGRNIFQQRRMLVCKDRAEALTLLQSANSSKQVRTANEAFRDRPVAFLFPGLGEQYVGVTQELYQQEATFRETIDRCCHYLKHKQGISLKEVLFPPEAAHKQSKAANSTPDLRAMLGRNGRTPDANTERLMQTALAQPAVFVIEYSLAQLLISWGIHPQGMLGYSVGEYVAACLAGVLSLEDALLLVAKRAQLIQEQPAGVMMAVALSEQKIQPFLSDQVSLATINAPNTCVLAGPAQAIQHVQQRLEQQDIVYRQIEATHAFHSTMLEPLRASVTQLARSITLNPPQIPYISNVTGTWITAEQATDPGYWAQHMCQTVRFADGVEQLLQKPELLLLEVGPGQSLCSFVKQHPAYTRDRSSRVLATLPSAHERISEQAYLVNALGALWLAGVTLDWDGFYAHERRLRVPLPTYPFERQRYWVDPPKQARASASVSEQLTNTEFSSPLDKLPRTPDLTNWFSVPTWKQGLPLTAIKNSNPLAHVYSWLIFVDEASLGLHLKNKLVEHGQRVITVAPGTGFSRLADDSYTIQPSLRADYEALFAELTEQEKTPSRVVHLWNVTQTEEAATLDNILQNSFYSLIALAQALGDVEVEQCEISIISNGVQEVLGDDLIHPEKATVIGPCRVIPQEYANLSCRNIDVNIPASGSRQEEMLIQQLLAELTRGEANEVVALRSNRRWIQHFEPVPLQNDPQSNILREQGVYLITGGLGGIALAMANYLARQVQAKIVLVGRSGLPPRQEWPTILSTQGETTGIGRTIHQIQQLEELGAEVLVVKADVSNEIQMQAAIEQTLTTFGALHGVLHAAGVPGIGLIQLKTPEQTAQVISSKIQGTRVLEHVLRDQTLDFLVLFSSMTSITGGGPGQVDYCAANAYLDAYARRFAQTHGRTIAIDWGEWQWNAWEDGLAGYNIEAQEYFRAHRNTFGISFAEGTDAFTRILSANLPHVVVSTQDFQIVAEQSKSFTAAAVLQHTQESRQNREMHPRPTLASAYAFPNSDLERQITAIWEELLGITPVGIDDNFFELGGNSLLGIDLIGRLKKKLRIKTLASHVIYEAPTVSTLARFIEKGKTEMSVDEWQGRSEKRRAGLKQRIREASRVTK
jgi:phthiocerol/phenolphthiocerol synthesis type-I polyketide synthase E